MDSHEGCVSNGCQSVLYSQDFMYVHGVYKCSSSYYKLFCFKHCSKMKRFCLEKTHCLKALYNTALCKLSPGCWVKQLKYCYNVFLERMSWNAEIMMVQTVTRLLRQDEVYNHVITTIGNNSSILLLKYSTAKLFYNPWSPKSYQLPFSANSINK